MPANFVKDLLAQMTLKEKIGQMIQIHSSTYYSVTGSEDDTTVLSGPWGQTTFNNDDLYNLGSMLTIEDREELIAIQTKHMKHNRLGIPLLFMYDIIHGYKTIFPMPLAQASSWDEALVEATTRVASIEGSIAGQHVSFSPMCDLVRDPRWGRVMESPGEDPYLNQLMSAATVRGFQGNSLLENYTMAACTKHFAGYGASEGGRDYNTVDISEQWLREYYLSGYKAAIDAGSEMVMTSFNIFQGIPATVNKHLMKDILRDDLGFEGVLISDWDAAREAIVHGACEDDRDCCIKTIGAGLDIEMTSHIYNENLESLVKEGTVSQEVIDTAVTRILTLKHKLGLFENPFRYADAEKEGTLTLSDDHRRLAKEAAIKSSVLLKNDGTLPFSKDIKTVAIIGPHCDNKEILGWWAALGDPNDSVTIDSGIKNLLGPNVSVLTAKGCDFNDQETDGFDEAMTIASQADIIILALGEHYTMSGEAHNRSDIKLPGMQEALAETILTLNKPTATVLLTGRPLDLSWLNHHMPAILNVWFPGTEGGNAVADLLFGEVSPSGKITMSFPRSVGQIPLYYNHFNTGRPEEDNPHPYGTIYQLSSSFGSNYQDIPNAPLYPFGYGLSYTSFDYSALSLSDDTLRADGQLTVSLSLKNTGTRTSDEIVQLYIRDIAASVVRPVKELKAFKKITLNPNETQKVTFSIKEDMLRFHTADMSYKSEKGRFEVHVGPNSRDTTKLAFKLI